MTFSFFFKTAVSFRQLAMVVLNWLFGHGICIVCGRDTSLGVLCRKCRREMMLWALSDRKRCTRCSRILLGEQGICMDCRSSSVLSAPSGVFCVFPYRMWMKNLMFEWKMMEMRSLTLCFAEICAASMKKRFPGCNCIVPVPPRPGKIREKGWDQIEDLCRILSGCHGFRILRVLERTSVRQQKKLGLAQRLENCGTSYVLSENGRKLAQKGRLPDNAVLLDDVMTTGATVERCSEILLSAGIEKIQVLTLFIVD